MSLEAAAIQVASGIQDVAQQQLQRIWHKQFSSAAVWLRMREPNEGPKSRSVMEDMLQKKSREAIKEEESRGCRALQRPPNKTSSSC
eukprot:6458518-Amphidinium_carterae.3